MNPSVKIWCVAALLAVTITLATAAPAASPLTPNSTSRPDAFALSGRTGGRRRDAAAATAGGARHLTGGGGSAAENGAQSPKSDPEPIAAESPDVIVGKNWTAVTGNATGTGTEVTESAEWGHRWRHTSARLKDGTVLIMGGYGVRRSGGSTGGAIGPYYFHHVWASVDGGVTWQERTRWAGWRERASHASVVLHDGTVLVMGGYMPSRNLNDVWASTNGGATWTDLASRFEQSNTGETWDAQIWTPRRDHASVVLHDRTVLVIGGLATGNVHMNDVWMSYEGAFWECITEDAGWSKRRDHAAVVLPDGSVLIMGGWDGESSHNLNDVWRSGDKGRTWTEVTAAAPWSPRSWLAALALGDGNVLVMGGTSGLVPPNLATPRDGHTYHHDVWRSSDQGSSWTELTDAAGWSARAGHTVEHVPTTKLLPSDGVLLIGGSSGANPPNLDAVWQSIKKRLVCPPGSEAITESPITCKNCQPGTFSALFGNGGCTRCALGTFTNSVGAESCDVCPPGTFTDGVGSLACRPCPAGSVVGVGSTECVACPGGTVKTTAAGTLECSESVCPPGTKSRDATDSTECEVCPVNTFSPAGTAARSECEQCPAGTHTNGKTGVAGSDGCVAGAHPCLCLSTYIGVVVIAVTLVLTIGAVSWARLITAWSLNFDLLMSVGSFGTDVLYVTTQPYATQSLLILSVVSVFAPSAGILIAYMHDAGRPGMFLCRWMPAKLDSLAKFVAFVGIVALNLVRWLLLLAAAALLVISKAGCAAPVTAVWVHAWHGDNAGVLVSSRSVGNRFNLVEYNRLVFAELVLEALPQLWLQLTNHRLQSNPWGGLAAASVCFSVLFAVSHLYRFGYYVFKGGRSLWRVPQPGIEYTKRRASKHLEEDGEMFEMQVLKDMTQVGVTVQSQASVIAEEDSDSDGAPLDRGTRRRSAESEAETGAAESR